jgi:hypothetical protein
MKGLLIVTGLIVLLGTVAIMNLPQRDNRECVRYVVVNQPMVVGRIVMVVPNPVCVERLGDH